MDVWGVEDRIAQNKLDREQRERLRHMTEAELGELYCTCGEDITLSLTNGLIEECFNRGITFTDLENYCL